MKNLCDVIKYGGFLISYAAAQRPFFHSRPRGRNRDLARFIGRLAQHKSLKDLVL